LRQEIPAISKATVYNTLSLFEEKGLVTAFATDQGKARYDLVQDPHGHFICQSCREVTDISCKLKYDPIIEGFKVQSTEVVIRGICKKCQKI
jgi:Fe2+ or Zn2+ uptake regulation protein